MLNKKLHLSKNIFKRDIKKIPTRNGYGTGLVKAGKKDENVVVLTADLRDSTRASVFAEKFPKRFIEVGVAEQALATIASGMANYGKIPFISSFAIFSPGRNWEQIRTTICLNNVPVKIIGSHGGITVGEDGATHQALEDIALMRVLPNMVVIYPADSIEAEKATLAAAKNKKPTYIRLNRNKTPVFTTKETPFEIGKAEIIWEAKDPKAVIIAMGPMVYESLRAAKELSKSKIEVLVINNHTIKPMNEQTIIQTAKITGSVVTVEDHQIKGGLGSAVSEVLSKNFPTPMEFVGMQDEFGESGKPSKLLKKYKMTPKDITLAVKRVIRKKNY